jgi:hypothetical protein
MKKSLLLFTVMIFCFITFTGCSNNDKKESGSIAKVETKGMTTKEAKAFLDADVANKGKEVTVAAYSWGTNNRMGGEVQLNLGDKKREGAQQADFSCIFKKEEAAAVKAIAKDAMVTITGKIVKGSGGIELTDCKIVE